MLPRLLLLLTLFSLPVMGWGQIISQYIETNSGTTPKGVEIWNNTGADIVFSTGNNLQIRQGTNGGSCGPTANTTSGTLKAGEVWIIGTSDLTGYATTNGADVSGTTTYGFSFNGDDALQVWLGGTLIDEFGTCGSDPGSAWTGSGVSTANQNISILAGITSGTTTGWTDPSTRFETTSTNPTGSGGMAGFGDAPSVPSTPTITLSETTLNNLDYILGNGPSAEQSFTAEGSNLTADITITAPTNFEVSMTSGSGFGSSVTLNETGGSVAVTTIYVRLAAGLGINNFTGTLSATSTGATQKDVSLSGDVTTSSLSNIIADGSFMPTSNIAYASYSATSSLTTGNAIKVGQFVIQDGGGAVDADALSTELTAISFDITNHANIAALAIFDGTTNVSEQTTIGATTSFSGLSLSAADDGSKTFSLYATFESTVTDNQQLEFTISSATADASGSIFAAADAGGATTSTTGDANRIEVTATDLIFNQDVSNTVLSLAMVPSPTVEAYDANVNLDLDFSASVIVTISSGTTTFNGSATTSVTAASGVATFNNLIFATVANGNVLTASATGLSSANSSSFDVAAAPLAPTPGIVFITEIVDANSDFNAEYIEIFNNSSNTIDLSNSKLIRVDAGTNTSEYVFDFGSDESTANDDVTIPPFGFIIVARGATKAEYETEWGALASGISYNGGNSNNFFGTGRRWRLRDGGTSDIDDGTLIDDTDGGVGTVRDIQNVFSGVFSPIGTRNDANPGELDYLLFNGGSWVNNNAIGSGTGSEDVLVYDNLSIASDVSSNDLSIASGGSVTISSNATLTINGDYTNNGTVTVTNGSSVLMDAGTVITGSMTVQRIGTQYKNIYNYWSSPVEGATWNSVWGSGYNSLDWYQFDEANQAFISYGTGTDMNAGEGYAMTGLSSGGTNTVDFTGKPHNGLYNVSLHFSNDANNDNDYNLVGNPYPSAIAANTFTTANSDISGTLWFWDRNLTGTNVTADYSTWTSSGGTAGSGGGEIPGDFIGSCQGFMIQATAATSVDFTNAQRISGNNTQFYKQGDDIIRLWLTAESDNQNWNQILIAFTDEATDGYDRLYDGKKLKGNPNIAFYSKLNGDDYAIQALAPLNGQSKSVPLGLDAGKAGNYTIAIDSIDGIDPGVGIYLHDVTTNTYHDLRNSSYTLTVNQDNSTLTQYELVFNATPTGIDDLGEESWFTAFTAGQTVIVRSSGALAINQLRLIDLQGRVVYSGATNGPEARIATTGLASGIYLLEALSDKGLQTKKVFIP